MLLTASSLLPKAAACDLHAVSHIVRPLDFAHASMALLSIFPSVMTNSELNGLFTLTTPSAQVERQAAPSPKRGSPEQPRYSCPGARGVMGKGLPACAKCGHAGYKIEGPVRVCALCGHPKAAGRLADSSPSAGSPGRAPYGPTRATPGGTRARSALAAARPSARALPHPSTFGHLSPIMSEAFRWHVLVGMLEKAGAGKPARRGMSKQELLYGVLMRLHESSDHGVIVKILEAACAPGTGGRGTREKINRYIKPHGLMIDRGGRAARAGRALGSPNADIRAFCQRNYHPLVIGQAREKFLKAEYFGAIIEAYKALEGLIRAKSGIDDYGGSLMKRAFGKCGALEVAMPGLTPKTKKNLQRGLAEMCSGVVSNVRNPVSHESELRFHVGRLEALDILLSTISYLCWEVGWTRRKKRDRRAARRGGRRGAPRHGANVGR